MVNPELGNRPANRCPVSEISRSDGTQASGGPDLSVLVLEIIEPFPELVGLLYKKHLANVSDRIRRVQCVFGR